MEIPSVVWDMPLCDSECLEKERHVLLDLYRSLGGKNWIRKWDIDANGTASNTSFHCDWHGILCDSNTRHIMNIYLSYNNVHGELHVNLSNVHYLLSFSIGYNAVNGRFENIVASMPKYLVKLEMSNSDISGRIPKHLINNVPILSKLMLSGSDVSGEIPEAIGDLVHLTVLNLGETNISGSIPQSISRLKNLLHLDLETLRLKGNLFFLYNLTKLRQLRLLSNRISGQIPEFIGERCRNLTELRLPNNKLSGYLPRSLGMLNKLQTLNIEKNNLSGLLPAYLFKLKLKVLVLSSNNFTGFEFNGSATFRYLHIFRASHLPAFNCSLDTIVSYLKGSEETIMQIDISHSNIYGQIPLLIFMFRRLSILKLASNMLTGQIPAPWQDLPYFTVLDLKSNDLYGPIPMTFSRLSMLTELDFRGNKQLKGSISPAFMVLDYQMKIKEEISYTCPMVEFVHNKGTIYVDSSYYNREHCYCARQYFGNGIHCKLCLEGGTCPGTQVPASEMKDLTPDEVNLSASAMFLKTGYYPFPSESNVKSIHKCPPSSYKDRICVPEKNCSCYFNASKEEIYCNTSCLCRQGHHGRFCSQCSNGYYKDGIHCNKCYSKSREPGIIALFIVGVLVIFFSYFVIPCCFQKDWVPLIIILNLQMLVFFILAIGDLAVPFYVHTATALLVFILFSNCCTVLSDSAMFYFQVMGSLISSTDIWPKFIQSLQAAVISSFNLNYSSLGCSFPKLSTPIAKGVIIIVLPLFCLLLVWVANFLLKQKETLVCCCNANECGHRINRTFLKLKEKFDAKNCKTYSLNILDFAYFPNAEYSISVLSGCDEIDRVSFLKEFPWIDCSGSDYKWLFVISVIQIIFVILFPIVLCVYFYCNSEDLDTTSSNDKWFSSLLAQYTPKWRPAKHSCIIIKRLCIGACMAFLPTYPSLLTSICSTVLVLFIIIQLTTKPFTSSTKKIPSKKRYCSLLVSLFNKCFGADVLTDYGLENMVDSIMLFAMTSSIVGAEVSSGKRDWIQKRIFVIIVVTNVLCIGMLILSLVYRLLACGEEHHSENTKSGESTVLVSTNESHKEYASC